MGRTKLVAMLTLGIAAATLGHNPATGEQVQTGPRSRTLGASLVAQGASPPLACGTAPPKTATPDPYRTRYEVTLRIEPSNGSVRGSVVAEIRAPGELSEIQLRAWPNAQPPPGRTRPVLTYGAVTVDGNAVTPRALPGDPTLVVLPVATRRAAGESTIVKADFSLVVPLVGPSRMTRTPNGLRLGSFLPLLDWHAGRGWSDTPGTIAPGEAMGFPAADFVVHAQVPAGYDVLATGVRDDDGAWRAEAVRDIGLAVGKFTTVTQRVEVGPGRFVVARVAVDAGVADEASVYLDRIVRALKFFSGRYGTFPWPEYTVVLAPNLRGGIEYPMITHQGPGSSGRSTPHEVAHQWFYSLVGNDQGREPWIDEGLASWAEARFEGTVRDFAAKPIPAVARGRVTAPMTFWDTHRGEYYRGVYVATVQRLAKVNAPDLVDCGLRDFVAKNAYRVATAADVVAALQNYVDTTNLLGPVPK